MRMLAHKKVVLGIPNVRDKSTNCTRYVRRHGPPLPAAVEFLGSRTDSRARKQIAGPATRDIRIEPFAPPMQTPMRRYTGD